MGIERRKATLTLSATSGFARTTDRSIFIPANVPMELVDEVRVEDPFGAVGNWMVSPSDVGLWLTKLGGDPDLPHNEMVQILRTSSGILKLSMTSFPK